MKDRHDKMAKLQREIDHARECSILEAREAAWAAINTASDLLGELVADYEDLRTRVDRIETAQARQGVE